MYEGKIFVIAGAGIMGSSLAQVYAGAGLATVLYTRREATLSKSKDLIKLNQTNMIREDLITGRESAELIERIEFTTDASCFSDKRAALILENIAEDMNVKRTFWNEVGESAPEGCLLATNTSGLRIGEIWRDMKGRERFMGQHWLNPPHLLPICEIITSETTSEEAAGAMEDLIRFIGKKPVRVKDIPGFLINRLQLALLREALWLVESGSASPEDIDSVFRYGLGLRLATLGPFGSMDLGGVDTFHKVASYLFAELDDSREPGPMLTRMVEAGKHGVKSGEGFYEYSGGRDKAFIEYRDETLIALAKLLFRD